MSHISTFEQSVTKKMCDSHWVAVRCGFERHVTNDELVSGDGVRRAFVAPHPLDCGWNCGSFSRPRVVFVRIPTHVGILQRNYH